MSLLNFAFSLAVNFVFVSGAVQWKGQWTEVVAKRSLDSRCRETEREGELGPLQMLESALSPGLQCHQSLNNSRDYLPALLGDKQCLCLCFVFNKHPESRSPQNKRLEIKGRQRIIAISSSVLVLGIIPYHHSSRQHIRTIFRCLFLFLAIANIS